MLQSGPVQAEAQDDAFKDQRDEGQEWWLWPFLISTSMSYSGHVILIMVNFHVDLCVKWNLACRRSRPACSPARGRAASLFSFASSQKPECKCVCAFCGSELIPTSTHSHYTCGQTGGLCQAVGGLCQAVGGFVNGSGWKKGRKWVQVAAKGSLCVKV